MKNNNNIINSKLYSSRRKLPTKPNFKDFVVDKERQVAVLAWVNKMEQFRRIHWANSQKILRLQDTQRRLLSTFINRSVVNVIKDKKHTTWTIGKPSTFQVKDVHSSKVVEGPRTQNFNYVLEQIQWFLDQRFSDKVSLNEETQKSVEFICEQPVEDVNPRLATGLDKRVLNSVTGGYLMSKEDIIEKCLGDLVKHCKESADIGVKDHTYYVSVLFEGITPAMVRNIIYYTYHVVLSNQSTDNLESECSVVKVAITIGKFLVKNYYSTACRDYRLEKGDILFRMWKEIWRAADPVLASEFESDEFLLFLGSKIIEVMERSDLVKKGLIKTNKEQMLVLNIVDTKTLNVATRDLNFPASKLPMIVKPRNYVYNKGKGNEGGYLLNEDTYSEELFIDKRAYKVSSYAKIENIVFNMVNGVSSTPFKINTELLSFIKSGKLDLLLQEKHEYESLDRKLSYHKGKIKAHNSKYILQNTILKIADCFETLPGIFFPVRLDQRGRLYCEPQYFNYQSTELARALLLFAKPSIIYKSDMESVKYLKILGANYFGLDKRSIQYKISWVDKNINNIINYEKGLLLSQAKEKILFLSFCIEYTKFNNFVLDDDMMEYHTYFPIQLDATCNGFQHMALLSSELELLPELNLIKDHKLSKGESKDFYTFVLLRVQQNMKNNMIKDNIELSLKESLERLTKFGIDRTIVKKAIMTLPYNSSHEKRREYVINALSRKGDWDAENKVHWYWDGKNKDIVISNKDVDLLVSTIRKVIVEDHERIGKLNKYLRNIASLFVKLDIPIVWNLPTGLVVSQSYMVKKSTSISPFQHSKIKLNLLVTKDEFDQHKQVRSLMPNLIHSLDASSLCMLYDEFSKKYDNPQFYSVHDCFATTFDKVDQLKAILASIYTDMYISDSYLESFDKYILEQIKQTSYHIDVDKRVVILEDKKKYQLHSIDWVLNKKVLTKKQQLKIDSQFVLI